MNNNKDVYTAITGTIIIHLIAFLFLYYGVMRAMAPLNDGGIPIVFVETPAVASITPPAPSATPITPPSQNQVRARQSQPRTRQTQPQPRPNQPQNTTTRPAMPTSGEKVITQNKDESVGIANKTNNENEKIAEENARKEELENESSRQEEVRQRQKEAIDNLGQTAFNTNNTQNNQENTSPSSTNQGGNPASRSTGVQGVSGSSNVSGRSLIGDGKLPSPAYTEQEEGRIVIDIIVDPSGSVIWADIGRGTNITNISMRNSAIAAALRAKYNKISGTNNQNGKITYNYRLK